MILETAFILNFDLKSKIQAETKAEIRNISTDSKFVEALRVKEKPDKEIIELFEKLFKSIEQPHW